MPLAVEIVTAERSVLADTADMVVAPSVDGVVGILPRHAPMIALLKAGELRLKKGAGEIHIAVAGGIMQVEPDHVRVLADAAERVEEIDEARAREALDRATQRLPELHDKQEAAAARAAIERARARLQVVERRRRNRSTAE